MTHEATHYCKRCGETRAMAILEGVGYVHLNCMKPSEKLAHRRAVEKKRYPNGRKR